MGGFIVIHYRYYYTTTTTTTTVTTTIIYNIFALLYDPRGFVFYEQLLVHKEESITFS